MTPILTLVPTDGTSIAEDYRVRSVQFRKSHEATETDGVNVQEQRYSVVAQGLSDAAMTALQTSLELWRGVTAFFWSAPNDFVRTYTCESWSSTRIGDDLDYPGSGIWNFQGTFVQAFILPAERVLYWGQTTDVVPNLRTVASLNSGFGTGRNQIRSLSLNNEYVVFSYPAALGVGTFYINSVLVPGWIQSTVTIEGEAFYVFRSPATYFLSNAVVEVT